MFSVHYHYVDTATSQLLRHTLSQPPSPRADRHRWQPCIQLCCCGKLAVVVENVQPTLTGRLGGCWGGPRSLALARQPPCPPRSMLAPKNLHPVHSLHPAHPWQQIAPTTATTDRCCLVTTTLFALLHLLDRSSSSSSSPLLFSTTSQKNSSEGLLPTFVSLHFSAIDNRKDTTARSTTRPLPSTSTTRVPKPHEYRQSSFNV